MAKGFLNVVAQAAQSESIWYKSPIRLTDGAFWSSFFGNLSSSGKSVTTDSAMRLSTVWACVRLISNSVAGLPYSLYRRQSDGGRVSARDFSLYDVIHTSPNDEMTAFQFWQAIVASMLLWGNAYAKIHRRGDGTVIGLEFILPRQMTVECGEDGNIKYWYKPKTGARQRIQNKDMLHIPAFALDGRVGLSAIRYGVDVMGAAMSADEAANSTFKNGLMPAVAFKVDRILQKHQREEFRAYTKELQGSINAGQPPILEQGVSTESIGINPVDAQLLESRSYSVEEIARWFGVPPWMIGHTDKGSNWGTGLEQQMISFLTFVISPITSQIQQCVNKRLLTPVQRVTLYSEFNLEGLLRADSATRAELYSKMAQNGIWTRDDCREKENLPRMGGNAAVLTVQSNLVPIDKLGESTESQTVRAALTNWLEKGE